MKFPYFQNVKVPATTVAATTSTKAWGSYLTFGNALAVYGIVIPFVLGAIRSRSIYNDFKGKYFPNVARPITHNLQEPQLFKLSLTKI